MPGKKYKSMPEGWKRYSNIGLPIPNTRFIPFKTPLKEETCKKCGVTFSPKSLLRSQPKLKMIIDLTNTDDGRYYKGDDFIKHGIRVEKIKCPGGPQQVPSRSLLEQFYKLVDGFLGDPDNGLDTLIGVHCTHGLNRTGYFICKYMTEKMGLEGTKAIRCFQTARGHPIERKLLIKDILSEPLTGDIA